MQSRSEILLARKQARLEKDERDQDILELHRKVVDALLDPKRKAFVLKKAHERIDMWEARKFCHVN